MSPSAREHPSLDTEISLHAFSQLMAPQQLTQVVLLLQQAFILSLRTQKILATVTKDMVGSISAIISYLVEATDRSNRVFFVWDFFFFNIFSLGGRSRLHSLPSSIFTTHAMCIASIGGYKS